MSDANEKQSVAADTCKYGHQWHKQLPTMEADAPETVIACIDCGKIPTRQKDKEQAAAIVRLREWIKPGDTVHVQLKHVSRSGMLRVIQPVKIECAGDREPPAILYLGYNVAKAGVGSGYDDSREGVRMGGCGMDMGFALVYELSHTLYPSYECLGEKCPSNEHVNDRNSPRGPGVMHRNGYALHHRWL